MENTELFGEAHEQEENGLFGKRHQAEQLNLLHSSLQLKEKEKISFEDYKWKYFYRQTDYKWTRKTDSYVHSLEDIRLEWNDI